ncbi:hypothetical protein FL966_00310 [Caproiciproducens galactitolivorans]|uniref:Uncharacterized protein n=1 Tax=Caproiciproducens galactitolivorans TaxID=642589 RepID=A0A4Z0YH52_9FIRM|nr:hypothetical protein [Caproiciproducens galactitolivorans]QEY33630.1 hypothetical protein FL966_00310 [Caproiciproducens galactitolivorans]TGJ76252.1 hypothetical protein CAGA_17160 [Caproiciproducens galactitolivorans]
MQRGRLTPAQSVVYLNSVKSETLKGHIYSEHYKKTMQFQSEWELLNGMDNMFDSIGFPQAAFQSRKFRYKKARRIVKRVEDTVDESLNDFLKEKPTTFIVNVQYRMNGTWQGTITWVEKNQTQHFRSAFEMLKLMEQANMQGNTEVIRWEDEKRDS